MFYTLAADLIIVMHLAFVMFVMLGGVLVLRWHRLLFLHLPAASWGALIEFQGWLCPLTPLEQALRQAAGESQYAGSFVEHYLVPILYPAALDADMQFYLGMLVIAFNLVVYAIVFWQLKRKSHADHSRRK